MRPRPALATELLAAAGPSPRHAPIQAGAFADAVGQAMRHDHDTKSLLPGARLLAVPPDPKVAVACRPAPHRPPPVPPRTGLPGRPEEVNTSTARPTAAGKLRPATRPFLRREAGDAVTPAALRVVSDAVVATLTLPVVPVDDAGPKEGLHKSVGAPYPPIQPLVGGAVRPLNASTSYACPNADPIPVDRPSEAILAVRHVTAPIPFCHRQTVVLLLLVGAVVRPVAVRLAVAGRTPSLAGVALTPAEGPSRVHLADVRVAAETASLVVEEQVDLTLLPWRPRPLSFTMRVAAALQQTFRRLGGAKVEAPACMDDLRPSPTCPTACVWPSGPPVAQIGRLVEATPPRPAVADALPTFAGPAVLLDHPLLATPVAADRLSLADHRPPRADEGAAAEEEGKGVGAPLRPVLPGLLRPSPVAGPVRLTAPDLPARPATLRVLRASRVARLHRLLDQARRESASVRPQIPTNKAVPVDPAVGAVEVNTSIAVPRLVRPFVRRLRPKLRVRLAAARQGRRVDPTEALLPRPLAADGTDAPNARRHIY